MPLVVTDQGNVIKVTGTTTTSANVSVNFLRLGGVLWYAPSTQAHLLSITDKGGNQIVKGKCVTANASNWWDLDNLPVNGIKIDDVNNEDVFDFVDQANAQALGGFTDWRMPNIFELLTLLVLTGGAPFIDGVAFPSAPNGIYWSSTTYPVDTAQAFGLTLVTAYHYNLAKATAKNYCRLVRG